MPLTEKECDVFVPIPGLGRGVGVGFFVLCAAIGSEIKTRTQIKSSVMEGSKLRRRRIVHDTTDSMSLHLAGGWEQLEKHGGDRVLSFAPVSVISLPLGQVSTNFNRQMSLLDLDVFSQPVRADIRRVDGALLICHNA